MYEEREKSNSKTDRELGSTCAAMAALEPAAVDVMAGGGFWKNNFSFSPQEWEMVISFLSSTIPLGFEEIQ